MLICSLRIPWTGPRPRFGRDSIPCRPLRSSFPSTALLIHGNKLPGESPRLPTGRRRALISVLFYYPQEEEERSRRPTWTREAPSPRAATEKIRIPRSWARSPANDGMGAGSQDGIFPPPRAPGAPSDSRRGKGTAPMRARGIGFLGAGARHGRPRKLAVSVDSLPGNGVAACA